ncbi:MAG: hypothetical protein HYU69_03590 [Bacteroidetes bacterium]|nr:hypothetical protein [Bacteroidota bacterium]
MKRHILFSVFFIASVCGYGRQSYRQTTTDSAETVTRINPDLFPFGVHIFKRVENKTGKKMYKLGLKSDKLYVIDAKGNVQDFTFLSSNLLIPVNGGNAAKKIQNRKLNNVVKDILTQAGTGVKFTFENIVVQDKAGKQMTGLVEPLQMVKIK